MEFDRDAYFYYLFFISFLFTLFKLRCPWTSQHTYRHTYMHARVGTKAPVHLIHHHVCRRFVFFCFVSSYLSCHVVSCHVVSNYFTFIFYRWSVCPAQPPASFFFRSYPICIHTITLPFLYLLTSQKTHDFIHTNIPCYISRPTFDILSSHFHSHLGSRGHKSVYFDPFTISMS